MESLKGKLTEEEARRLLSVQLYTLSELDEKIIKKWRREGYIKQNPVEKAEEWFNLQYSFYSSREVNMLNDFKDAIDYLKNKIKELER